MTGSDGITPADHRSLPRAATWRFMTELRRRARGPPVDSRDDHPTVVASLDPTAYSTKISTVRSQTSRPASHGHLAMTCMIAITGLDDFFQTESAITITGIRNPDREPWLDRGGDDGANPGDRAQTPHIVVTLGLHHDGMLQFADLSVQPLDLLGDLAQGEAGSLRETLVGLVAHDLDQG